MKKCWNIIKIYIYQLEECTRTPKEIIEYWLRKIKIYKIEKFNSVFSTDEGPIGKKIQYKEKKF
jgi:hypothetical protein